MAKPIKPVFLLLTLLFALQINGQCKIINNAFQAGEDLTYDVYFKYGLLHKKAGISTLKVKDDKYNGRNTYKVAMTANSTGLAKKIFTLSDTMYCHMTKELEPLSYTKYAHEGDDYTQEFITYGYSSGNIDVHAKLTRNTKLRHDTIISSTQCVYDMMSIVYYARTLDYAQMKSGDSKNSLLISDKNKLDMKLKYDGIEKIEANDGNEYDCIVLTLIIDDKAFKDKKEAMKIYISNDNNRIPVRINSKLKVGSTYVLLKEVKGNRHPLKTSGANTK